MECAHLRRIALAVPRMVFRSLKDRSEVETMSRISHLSWMADGIEWFVPADDMMYSLGDGGTRGSEVVFAEVEGTVVGYSMISWDSANAGHSFYRHSVHVLPEWRGKGLTTAMFRSNEDRLRVLHRHRGSSVPRGVEVWAVDTPSEWKDLVESSGYKPSWHLLELVHSDLSSVEEAPEPEGLDFGPVRPEEYPLFWSLCRECFSGDSWSTPERWSEQEYGEWVRSDRFVPALWEVARAGRDVVGLVENYMNEAECRSLGRRIAHANMVCVRSDWRRKGVATCLLTKSLKHLRDIGVEEVTLDTGAENVSTAVKVYEGVGFVVRRKYTFYVKPL